MFTPLLTVVFSATFAHAHVAPFHKAMYGLNGTTRGTINLNNNDVVQPLYNLTKDQWWLNTVNRVPDFPPAEGDFLDLPAGGNFTVEMANNQGQTSLSFGGQYTSEWTDGKNHSDFNDDHVTCISSPNMHTQNETRAAGTAFAIAYTSDIKEVTPDNLVVFTVRYHTPWKRLTSYDVPAGMPACPSGGCICAWGWVPNGCGIPNMYHLPYRCNVTGATSTKAIGTPKPPVWCENNPSNCTSGPKQMLYWNQLDGNNIKVEGFDANGDPKSPAYNAKCGFPDGAQDDIFTGASTDSPSASSSGTKSSSNSPSGSSTASSSGSAAPFASAQPAQKVRHAPTVERRLRSFTLHRKRSSRLLSH